MEYGLISPIGLSSLPMGRQNALGDNPATSMLDAVPI